MNLISKNRLRVKCLKWTNEPEISTIMKKKSTSWISSQKHRKIEKAIGSKDLGANQRSFEKWNLVGSLSSLRLDRMTDTDAFWLLIDSSKVEYK